MSTEKCHIWFAWTLLPVIVLTATLSATDKYGGDQVVEFYCTQATAKSQSQSAFAPGVQAAATAHTLYKRVASDGRITSVDTAIVRYWFTGGIVDSQVVVSATSDGIPQVAFDLPLVFSEDYLFAFFPNDPGGEMLSIGFDTPDDSTTLPIGLAVIDRDEYVLRRLYLYYPRIEGYEHLSRGFRLMEFEGYLFPDSIWEVGSKEGIFSTENYRLEAMIDSVSISR